MRHFAKHLRSASTDAERLLWRYLRNRCLSDCKFRRQQIIGPYIVDFVCLEERFVVEIDGGQHAEQQEQDAARTSFLEAEGYEVVRFWNNDVLTNLEGVMGTISRMLAGHPSPQPSPPRGEGANSRLPKQCTDDQLLTPTLSPKGSGCKQSSPEAVH
jgi:very-short-patch-repair endonuclease